MQCVVRAASLTPSIAVLGASEKELTAVVMVMGRRRIWLPHACVRGSYDGWPRCRAVRAMARPWESRTVCFFRFVYLAGIDVAFSQAKLLIREISDYLIRELPIAQRQPQGLPLPLTQPIGNA